MTTTIERESAKIYSFTARSRKATSATRGDSARGVVAFMPRRVVNMDFGSAWYHEEATREAENERRR